MPKYLPFSRNKCPHCQTTVQLLPTHFSMPLTSSPDQNYSFHYIECDNPRGPISFIISECPECKNNIISFHDPTNELAKDNLLVIWPVTSGRPPAPPEVPDYIAQDYNEASLVMRYSPKASAALSRRCLQSVLGNAGNTTKRNLSDQINEVLPNLPGYIAENLDAVRNIGNFAAHGQKSIVTGDIVDVEPGEAEWNLDVLDTLFDFYYVRPEIERKKRDALAQKLSDAGKPPMKTP